MRVAILPALKGSGIGKGVAQISYKNVADPSLNSGPIVFTR